MTVVSLDGHRQEREAAKLRHPSARRKAIIAERLRELDECPLCHHKKDET